MHSFLVTELEDGVLIGCSLNHTGADGESFWHFFNSWSELNAGHETILRPPLMEQAQIPKELRQVHFPLSEHRPPTRQVHFCFSAEAISRIKAKANKHSKLQRGEISSLQALVGLMWRTITWARKLRANQITACKLAAGLRKRLDPTLPREYFGSCMLFLSTEAKVGELLGQNLGWAARVLHETVLRETANMGRQWLMNIQLYDANVFESNDVMVASSPWLEMYGSNFGWGKGLAVLSGSVNKFRGRISVFLGKGEGGSMDLEVCLLPHVMAALELDEELLDALLPSY
ncbi:uncharacterized acetyltransferase At3g50280-like [Nymphaea colorata]|uniref:Acetyltransferase n=1 Tax=Nymphaea colorata TaxID=210225 RepID=A0A5K0ZFD1_9MAGN|nr:uncharacterized acetyltransferase At3g50280-like [Nymphaea colorata]